MRIAINLLWVKPSKMGGVESYVRNLLDGFIELQDKYEFLLLTSKTNWHTFEKYTLDKRFSMEVLPVDSFSLLKTVLWENLYLSKCVNKLNVDFCFVPYYRCPITCHHGLRYVIVLHDLMALHFPHYYSKAKYMWLKYYWKLSLNKCYKIVTISNFVKEDIIKQYLIKEDKIKVIYNPVANNLPVCDVSSLINLYKVCKGNYFYTVSSLHKHKNLITIIKAFAKVNKIHPELKFVVSGITGNAENEIQQYIKQNELETAILFTGFISDEMRNSLMRYSKAFLFPSIFEGFGMPPIEAFRLGTKVVTTKCGSILEITEGKALYVDNPFNVEEWVEKMLHIDDYSFCSYMLFPILFLHYP